MGGAGSLHFITTNVFVLQIFDTLLLLAAAIFLSMLKSMGYGPQKRSRRSAAKAQDVLRER